MSQAIAMSLLTIETRSGKVILTFVDGQNKLYTKTYSVSTFLDWAAHLMVGGREASTAAFRAMGMNNDRTHDHMVMSLDKGFIGNMGSNNLGDQGACAHLRLIFKSNAAKELRTAAKTGKSYLVRNTYRRASS